jgi:N-acetylglutamate synthase-like GNAT family acetyltransferase
MALTLQQAAPEDLARCLKLLHEADEDDNRIRSAMTEPDNSTYLAYDGPTLIGAAVMRWQYSDVEILYIAVAEAMRGCGYGKQMIEALIVLA